MKQNNFLNLSTSDDKLPEVPLCEYPRPQLVRDSCINLNGQWDLATSSNKKIIVPYCVESALSRINYCYPTTTYYFYKKEFTLTSDFIKDKVLLHFDSVDQECEVYVNGNKVGEFEVGSDVRDSGYLGLNICAAEVNFKSITLQTSQYEYLGNIPLIAH